jgi:hypothetical protein
VKKIRYVGVHDEVDVPTWQLAGVRRGVPIEVPDAAAADLLTQPASWADVDDTTSGPVTGADTEGED